MDTDEFHAVGIAHEDSANEHRVMEAVRAAIHAPLLLGRNPKALYAKRTLSQEPIPGFEQYWTVIFLNGSAWQACGAAGLGLHSIRTIPASELPPKCGTLTSA